MIEIVAPGPLATIQDAGRTGFSSVGVGPCGAMDPMALRIGNRMLGNAEDAAGIEFTIGVFEILFHRDTRFALTGADCAARLDGVPIPPFWCMAARAGQRLKAGAAARGMRAYLTVEGGLSVVPVLGSASTDLKGGFGGLDGRALCSGDRLDLVGAPPSGMPADYGLDPAELGLLHEGATGAGEAIVVDYVPAAEYDAFTDEAIETFAGTEWKIHPDSNRIGYRLTGPQLALKHRLELRSHGILPGTIQVPPSGQPVVQLSDANTCGGYPKIGVVATADLWRLGQARLGDRVRFRRVTAAHAVDRLRARESAMRSLFERLDDVLGALAS